MKRISIAISIILFASSCGGDSETPTTTAPPEPVFRPALEERYRVDLEKGTTYALGATLDGRQIELKLDLAIPDTGDSSPLPLLLYIHGGGFLGGSREVQNILDPASRGWITASMSYRLAGDDPLPGVRVKNFSDSVGGEAAPALFRSIVAATEDTLTALDYLFERSDDLNIDKDRVVLKGYSAGAITSLHVAYCANGFNIATPKIAAVVSYSGFIVGPCGEGGAIDADEAPLFLAHGTEEDGLTSYSLAEGIVDAANAIGIDYEFHPIQGADHFWYELNCDRNCPDNEWNQDLEKIEDIQNIEKKMFEFLDRVLYSNIPTFTTPPTGDDYLVEISN